MSQIAQALTIAGSDSGGGAGIQADLKTFQMRWVFGMSVVTAVTAQNTLGVSDIHLIPTSTIKSQLAAIYQDFSPNAVKIGMLGTAEIIECVAEQLRHYAVKNLVVDPVMIAKGGASLLEQSAVTVMRQLLLPLADVITPNLPEAETLTGVQITDEQSVAQAAKILQELGAKTVVIKGGHRDNSRSDVCRDWIFSAEGNFVLESPRFATQQTHGTGCTFSACLAAELAKGKSVSAACQIAKDFVTAAISHPLNIGHSHGPTNHWAYAQLGANNE
ncbi:phosphomethylpyrimidine kinase [Gallibacterium genomosp. 3]|uniref:hydroxymethylpyrimidine kinase n=1 Tax=Gallibacterium genomosp. 3 TaxID=505345 RepID=A0A1A7PVJ6_9PAST|nr:bifunctional hydroxymethylpyrimidine kinase/phosphomethylpyrimidine kinase [Gallibacterium genomosp. 3]OBX05180.1 phosphomethylpyrimidine kinase [Gallibacterium genomosp. 3]